MNLVNFAAQFRDLGLTILTLAAALAGVGIGAYIAEAGGQVRHPEFRRLPPPGSGQ